MKALFLWIVDRLLSGSYHVDRSVGFTLQFPHFNVPQMRFSRQLDVVIKNVPLAFEFNDGMVRSPAGNGFHERTLVGEWPIR